ncbi:MAG: MarR family winged helix-turn-helix transcriptional regulator [Polyangiales bacterium]
MGSPVEAATRAFFTRMMTSLARTTKDEALSVGQIAAIFLVDQRGSARVSDIADALGLSLSATSRMTDGLVERDFFTRTEDPDDRRARVLGLTAAGRAFVEKLSEERMEVIRTFAATLPESLAGRVLSAIAHAGGLFSSNK